jgi:regulation of enolase protein 1 (concanavalin A-like superfamily)
MNRFVCLLVCLVAAVAGRADAANRTVCASGCQHSSVQAAVDAAAPGDVILLRAGETFTGNVVLRAKTASATAFITIRSDAPDSAFPAASGRLIPSGRSGANTARTALARLVGRTGTYRTTPVVRTEPGAHHYRLQFLEIDAVNNEGYAAGLELGAFNSTQTSLTNIAHTIVVDRVYIHGHPTKGLRRGVVLNSRNTDVLNSYIVDVMHLQDAQAIAGYNGPGPYRIVNNHLEATGENIMFGGADPKIANLVPSDIEIRGNYLTKPLRWRSAVLTAPASVTATVTTGGSLSAGVNYFKVVAMMYAGGETYRSVPSIEVAVTVAAGGAVRLSWPAVAGADEYRVYRGTASNGENVYAATSATSLTYTGTGTASGTPPASGTRWTVKNLLEFKNAQRVAVTGNLLEHSWTAAQDGTAVLLTPRNQEGGAPWSVVRDITISGNLIRRAAGSIRILGEDYNAPSQRTTNIRIVNNVFEVDTSYGGSGRFLVMTSEPRNITVDHNTIFNTGTIVFVDSPPISGFVYTNNLSRHNAYGIDGQATASGTATLDRFYPGWVFLANVLAGGTASWYPPGNFFPTVAQFDASFVNKAAGDYRLVSGSAFRNAGTDGKDIGADMGVVADVAGTIGGTSGAGGTEPPPGEEPPPGGGGTTLPEGWTSEDIGSTALAGSAAVAGGTFTVRGAGADIWGATDSFHFVHRSLIGDGSIVARVATVAGAKPWTKAGVMIRASADPRSAHGFMLVSTGRGLAFQRRAATGGTSTNTAGAAAVAPYWVRLTRLGNLVVAAASPNGTTWTEVGRQTVALSAEVLVGLALTSQDPGALASATFDNVAVTTGASLPAGWEAQDVGTVGTAGSTAVSGGTFTVRGAGNDVWGTKDEFHYAFTTLDGDGSITARVAGLVGTEAWTKAGVMIRHTLDAGAPHAFMLVSKGKGLAFQRRTVAGGTSTHTSGGSGTAPRWVRLTRTGSTITAAVSTNGTSWTTVGEDALSMSGPVYVGLAVSSHTRSALATATFDNVTIE